MGLLNMVPKIIRVGLNDSVFTTSGCLIFNPDGWDARLESNMISVMFLDGSYLGMSGTRIHVPKFFILLPNRTIFMVPK